MGCIMLMKCKNSEGMMLVSMVVPAVLRGSIAVIDEASKEPH